MPGGLRTARHCVFTGGVVEENGSCSAAFCESAARRKSAADFQLAEPSPSSLRDATSPEGGGFALLAARSRKAPLSGELARRKPCLRGFSQANVLRPLSQCLSALTALPKGEPLAVHANFIFLPRPLPLGEVSPKVTERARPLRKSAGGTERTLSVIAARCHLPRRGRFCSACRQITKSSPFGGAGCDQREQTERVCPPLTSPLFCTIILQK